MRQRIVKRHNGAMYALATTCEGRRERRTTSKYNTAAPSRQEVARLLIEKLFIN